MNIQGWNFDFESLPCWAGQDSPNILPLHLYEHERSDVACLLYSIGEVNICNCIGHLAILRKKENPVLYLAVRSFSLHAQEPIFSASGKQIFLTIILQNGKSNQYAFPLLVLDVAQNRFSCIRINTYSLCYHIEEISPRFFAIVVDPTQKSAPFDEKILDLDALEWFPMQEIESLPDRYFHRDTTPFSIKSPLLRIKREVELSPVEHKRSKPKAKVQRFFCVGCGVCLATCPAKAIYLFFGIHAHVDRAYCIGCGKCVAACPASVIQLKEVGP